MKWMTLFALCVTQTALAELSRPDFHRLVYALHEQQFARQAVRTDEENGAYNGSAAAGYRYRETRYYDLETGRLLSRIRRDAGAPEAIHIAEVNIYDANGRLTRDYLSIAPPWKPLHPSNAYLNLHHYNGKLHSFRQFELDGQMNYESCEGELGGKPVRISLSWDDINKEVTSTPEYRACFGAMTQDWKSHIIPH
ncbi:MAG: hypothetical protein B7X93_05225 [Hydrogenophilales bacterium 17-61-9]|nr:MAG: hypothetical protein B7X93_05225 [Hydrogenophilales bacterium 17-61-9]